MFVSWRSSLSIRDRKNSVYFGQSILDFTIIGKSIVCRSSSVPAGQRKTFATPKPPSGAFIIFLSLSVVPVAINKALYSECFY